MNNRVDISDTISVGSQPTADDLAGLKEEGFRSVVNLREKNEDDQSLEPDQEGKKVEELGMQYLHLPVHEGEMSEELVDKFREKIDSLSRPVYVHCKSGKRSGAFTLMHLASAEGKTGDEVIEQAKELGFECDQKNLSQFVKNYVDRHRLQD